jgi:EAL domain-containing protein (putative c-di-GMP-specific phosphodiesterase class I)
MDPTPPVINTQACHAVRQLISNGLLQVHFRPIVRQGDSRILVYEALVRTAAKCP